MSTIKSKLLEYPKSVDAGQKAIEIFNDVLHPLLSEFWYEDIQGQQAYGQEPYIDVNVLFMSWMSGALVPIVAYEDAKPVGILVAMRFKPLMYDANCLMINHMYAPTSTVKKSLLQFFSQCLPIWNTKEVWYWGVPGEEAPEIENITPSLFPYYRYVRE